MEFCYLLGAKILKMGSYNYWDVKLQIILYIFQFCLILWRSFVFVWSIHHLRLLLVFTCDEQRIWSETMTKISPEIEEDVQAESLLSVSADVSFSSNCFPKYKLGPDNQIVEESKEDSKGLSLKEVVEKETVQLSEQHKRLSVRDLASKFDKNLTAAAKLADEVPIFCSLIFSFFCF